MISFKLTEVKTVDQVGQVKTVSTIFIRPEDIKNWELATASYEVTENVGTPEESIVPKTDSQLVIIMKQKVKRFQEVNVPYLKNEKVDYRIEIRESEINMQFVVSDDIDNVLVQLEVQVN